MAASDERVTAMLRGGLSVQVVAAILDIDLADVRAVQAGVAELPSPVTIPEVQDALSDGTLVIPGSGGGPVAHDYVSNGDENGIFFALGTNEGALEFQNPARVGGPVIATESGILVPWEPPPHATYLTDRDSSVNIFHSSAAGSNWVRWDFGSGRSVVVREYTVRSRWDSGLYWPTAWKLQGSNDGAAWTDLDEVTDANFTLTDQWRHFTCDTVPEDPFTYIRLIDVTDTYLVLGEVELYGDIYTL